MFVAEDGNIVQMIFDLHTLLDVPSVALSARI